MRGWVSLDTRPLRALADGLLAWCDRDLHDLRVSDLDATHHLCLLDCQTFNLRFGPRDDTVHQSLLAVVTLELTVGLLTAEFHFTADQSCLRLFSTELLRELDEHAA
jgi:hypothetical protein